MIPKSAVKIDLSRDNLFDEMGMRRLRDSYMRPQEKSPQERFSYAVRAVASNAAHAQRLYDYVSKHWLSLSTPLLSYGRSKRGLPISCYLSYMPDTSEGLVSTVAEVSWLSMLGGGVGIGMGIRSEGAKSVGVMPHCKVAEAVSLAYRQDGRRGSFATYLDISHPNVQQFIDIRKPTGDANQRCQELHHGLNIPDAFMELVEARMLDESANDDWPLIDPATGLTKEVVSASYLWEQIILTRARTGEPFLHFSDTSNRNMPEFQKALGLKIQQSNICTEILLATDAQRTAICCLSSPNLEYWEFWKDNYQFYKDVAEMLDNAITLFCEKAPPEVHRAVYSATRERAIGIGALGWHALLQSKGIPFESALAVSLNHQVFGRYKKYLDRANLELGAERGECPDAVGYGLRFSHMTAIAPNASSSIIMGNTSPSIEPFRNNGYRQDTISGSYLNFNKYLDKILRGRIVSEEEYEAARSEIVVNQGSVQKCKYLTDYEKDVFKTFSEIDQMWVVQHAADRQPYIDQAQSLNLNFSATENVAKVHHVTFMIWKMGIPTAYYQRSNKLYHGSSTNAKAEVYKYDFQKSIEPDCLACE
jgi:ribonucleoside-diphosphate reductase alpha chain